MPVDATDLELLPLVMDLVEDVNSGKILPKDLVNDANFIKQRLRNFKANIASEIVGFIDAGERSALETDIARREKVLQSFKSDVEKKFGSVKNGDVNNETTKDNDVEMSEN